jgi:hypothetical protein
MHDLLFALLEISPDLLWEVVFDFAIESLDGLNPRGFATAASA